MKLIFGNTFLQQAEKYNITIDDLNQQHFDMEEIFDEGVKEACTSPKVKHTLKKINAILDTM